MSKIAIFAKIHENFAPPVQLHLSRTPFFPSAIFFEIFTIFTHFLLGFKKKILLFAEWNLPQRFFRARPLLGGKKSKILENRVGKIAFSKVQGHIIGLFARDGPRFFSIFFSRKIRIFSRKKIASRPTKMLERAFISQGKRTFRKEWIFAAAVFQSSSREKSEEQKLGSAFCRKGFFPNQTLRVLALTMVNGQVNFFGVFLRIPFGKNTFCDLHFFSSKNPDSFFRKKSLAARRKC